MAKQMMWLTRIVIGKPFLVAPDKASYKHAKEVAPHLMSFFKHFGECAIIQSDNGSEFKGVTKELLQTYGVHTVHGRARHPQSQGFVERANESLKGRIELIQTARGLFSYQWRDAAQEACHRYNTSVL